MSKKKAATEEQAAHADPEIARVADALALPDEEPAETDPSPAEEKPIPVRKARAARHGTYVVTDFCGELHRDGEKYFAGDEIQLSAAEAEALGPSVKPAE